MQVREEVASTYQKKKKKTREGEGERERERKRNCRMKVEKILSKDSIKPSTPTPNHLRSFKLSLLDQFSPPVCVPIILFYTASSTSSSTSPDIDHHQLGVSDQLKKSLSEALTRFYPLAGRIKDNRFVDCNDEGIEYFESRINGNISDFMKRDQQHHLLPPYDLHSTLKIIDVNDPQLIVQVTLFDCGGIAICVCISHKIADATTLATFINTWASITGDAESMVLGPTFDSAILYPPREGISPPFSGEIDQHVTQKGKAAENMEMRRLVFDGTKIAALRARYGNYSNGKKNKYFPTRVEAVIALIWNTAMAAASSSSPKPSVANLSVEIRRRLDPPLPEQSFGNLSTVITVAAPPSITKSSSSSSEVVVDLVSPLRESIRKINSDSLKVLQGDEGLLNFQELEVYWFTSWCRFSLYEADFGWGKPEWVAFGCQPFFNNCTCLMDNRAGDGIEAWICMLEEDMAIFERDQEFLDYISFVD